MEQLPRILLPIQSTKRITGQCDCACETAHQIVVKDVLCSTRWVNTQWKFLKQLRDSNYQAVVVPDGPVSVVVLNQSAIEFLNFFTEPASLNVVSQKYANLRESEIIEIAQRMAKYGLLEPFPVKFSPTHKSKPETLAAWLHLTDRCNLRCSYCYLPHVHEDMSFETGQVVIDAVFRSAKINGFKILKLKYAGGEPLLRFPLIEKLHRYAQLLAERNHVYLEGVVLSNGTLLTTEMIKTLKSLDLHLMISLDGLGQYHDRHRLYANGDGSFDNVADAVDLAIAHGMKPDISVTISNRTVDGLPATILWILERDLPFGLNFYRENDLSASRNDNDMQMDERKIIKGMLAAFKIIEDHLPRYSIIGGIVDRADLLNSHTHTCGVGQNYLVFDQNAQVCKCQMKINEPATNAYVTDPLAIIRSDRIGIQNLSVEDKEVCRTCEWKYWCAGGCPLSTYRITGHYDYKSPNCNIYKALFPEALRLEGLRLLKYLDDPKLVAVV